MTEISVGLCGPGRHEIPDVEDYIYSGEVESPLDFGSHQKTADEFINYCITNDIHHINLYITGLTPVLTSFLREWFLSNGVIGLSLYHYNRETNSYIAQEI